MTPRSSSAPSRVSLIFTYILIGLGVMSWLEVLEIEDHFERPISGIRLDLSKPEELILKFQTKAKDLYEVNLSSLSNPGLTYAENKALLEKINAPINDKRPIRISVLRDRDGVPIEAELRTETFPIGDRHGRSLAHFSCEPDTLYKLTIHVDDPSPLRDLRKPEICVKVPFYVADFHGKDRVLHALLALVFAGWGMKRLFAACIGVLFAKKADLAPDELLGR